ncbi:BTAD domain-containing putative transcriptional regulator [Geodermatophilus sp. SYSU D00703]
MEASGGSLSLAEGVRVDVRELEAWAERVLDPCIPGDDVGLPEDALCGELLPGWYEDWVLLERERLRQLRMHALEALADKLVTLRRYGEATEAAYAAVHAEPLRESAHRVVVRVHLAEGNITEALRAYDSFRTMLADELGISPTWQMTRCIAQAERRRDEWQGLPGHVHPDRPQRHGGGPDGGVRRIDQAGATIGTGRAGGVSAASTCPPAEQSPSPVVVEGPRR